MARRIPSYRHHKATGQARVTLNGEDNWLGLYGTQPSKDKYDAIITEWLSTTDVAAQDLTVAECCLHFWRFAKSKYGTSGKGPHGAAVSWKPALRLLKEHYGKTRVSQFGPKSLKRIVAEMVKLDWSRRYCIDQLNRAKQVFSYCASEALIPHTVYDRLRTVDAKAVEGARKTEPIQPVPDDVVDSTRAHCADVVSAMIQFERYTGCRPDEVCRIRPCDIQDQTEADDMEGLGVDGIAWDSSANGSIIVGSGPGAWIWDETNGVRLILDLLEADGLDLTGWTLREATGISDDGRIVVGEGINPDGNLEAWRADLSSSDPPSNPVPEPTTLAIWSLLGGIGFVVGHRRTSTT